jgi:hypothetical protein
MRRKVSEWTPQVINRLTELVAHVDGLSYRFIAEQMTKEFGGKFTRSGISGKIWRLRLPPGPPKKPVIKLRPATSKKPLPRSLRHRHMRNLQLLELERGDCKWPSGIRAPYTFCGKPAVEDGASYCAFHAKHAYVKPRKEWS